MINIINKSECCGCNACGDICPKGAISFKEDIEGFLYPVVDRDTCIDCHLCEKVCPVIHAGELKKTILKSPNVLLLNARTYNHFLTQLQEVHLLR